MPTIFFSNTNTSKSPFLHANSSSAQRQFHRKIFNAVIFFPTTIFTFETVPLSSLLAKPRIYLDLAPIPFTTPKDNCFWHFCWIILFSPLRFTRRLLQPKNNSRSNRTIVVLFFFSILHWITWRQLALFPGSMSGCNEPTTGLIKLKQFSSQSILLESFKSFPLRRLPEWRRFPRSQSLQAFWARGHQPLSGCNIPWFEMLTLSLPIYLHTEPSSSLVALEDSVILNVVTSEFFQSGLYFAHFVSLPWILILQLLELYFTAPPIDYALSVPLLMISIRFQALVHAFSFGFPSKLFWIPNFGPITDHSRSYLFALLIRCLHACTSPSCIVSNNEFVRILPFFFQIFQIEEIQSMRSSNLLIHRSLCIDRISTRRISKLQTRFRRNFQDLYFQLRIQEFVQIFYFRVFWRNTFIQFTIAQFNHLRRIYFPISIVSSFFYESTFSDLLSLSFQRSTFSHTNSDSTQWFLFSFHLLLVLLRSSLFGVWDSISLSLLYRFRTLTRTSRS